jgi:hypothetical protein
MKIASITASFIGQAVRLVIMYVETFKTVIIVFIGYNVFDVTMTDNFYYLESVYWSWQYHSVESKQKYMNYIKVTYV